MTELTERNPRHYKPKPTMSELSEKELLSMADCSVLLGVTVNTVRAEGRTIRYWDRAATEETPGSGDPDWTAGVKMRVLNGIFYILDVKRVRATPDGVRRAHI